MANRRTFGYGQDSLSMQPSSPMTPKGAQPVGQQDDPMMTNTEHPETMRRRLTPMVGEVEQTPTSIQALLSMLQGGQ